MLAVVKLGVDVAAELAAPGRPNEVLPESPPEVGGANAFDGVDAADGGVIDDVAGAILLGKPNPVAEADDVLGLAEVSEMLAVAPDVPPLMLAGTVYPVDGTDIGSLAV